jgi:hypothetical protein
MLDLPEALRIRQRSLISDEWLVELSRAKLDAPSPISG